MIFKSSLTVPDIPVMNLTQYVFSQAKKTVFGHYPDTPVIIDTMRNKKITFAEIEKMTIQLASGLQNELGIKKGMNVGVYASNDVFALPILYSTALIGGVLVPTFPQAPAEVLAHRIRTCPPVCMFTTSELLPIVREAMVMANYHMPDSMIILIRKSDDGKAEDKLLSLSDLLIDGTLKPMEFHTKKESQETLLVIPHTSGSTGRPKGMLVSHYSYIAQCACEVARDPFLSHMGGAEPEARSAIFSLFQTQAYGLYFSAIEYVCRGITTIEAKMFDIQDILEQVDRYRPFEIRGIPKIYYDWVNRWEDLLQYSTSSLQCLHSTGIIFAPQMKRALEELTGVPVSSEYGTSESMGVARNMSFGGPDYGVGELYPGVELKIVDGDDNPLGPEQLGQVCVKTLADMVGYVPQQATTSGAVTDLKSIRDSDGYFYTGDLGLMTENRTLRVFERMKDSIKTDNGYVLPSVIENKLYEHPSVADVVVLGIPSNSNRQSPMARAFIVPTDMAKRQMASEDQSASILSEIIGWVNKNCADSERLEGGAQFIDPLPIPRGDKGRHLVARMLYLDYQSDEPVVPSMISPFPGLNL